MPNENERPWGRYDILDTGPGYQVKRITVKPEQRLSYQSHEQRSEIWVIVSGAGQVVLDDEVLPVAAGSQVQIPVRAKHRMENLGSEPLVFIEVQRGGYLGEDDIVRYDDDYGRTA
jgi:mannose-6-phosphate isomerase